jgi:predicted permease
MRTVLLGVVAVLALAFIVLTILAIIRRHRPDGPRWLKSASACLAMAGLAFIGAGVVGEGGMGDVASGLMMIVLGTGIQFAPSKPSSKA